MNPSWRNVSSIWRSSWKAARLVKPWRSFSLTGEHCLNAFCKQDAICAGLGVLSRGSLKGGLSVRTLFLEGSVGGGLLEGTEEELMS